MFYWTSRFTVLCSIFEASSFILLYKNKTTRLIKYIWNNSWMRFYFWHIRVRVLIDMVLRPHWAGIEDLTNGHQFWNRSKILHSSKLVSKYAPGFQPSALSLMKIKNHCFQIAGQSPKRLLNLKSKILWDSCKFD